LPAAMPTVIAPVIRARVRAPSQTQDLFGIANIIPPVYVNPSPRRVNCSRPVVEELPRPAIQAVIM
jgi:hypothetical protein